MNRNRLNESSIKEEAFSSDDLLTVDTNFEADELEDARAFARLVTIIRTETDALILRTGFAP
jgi:hypothetical protein